MSAPKGDLRLLFSKPDLPKGRNFRCRRCQTLVEVVEIPGPFVDPDRFVCGECMCDSTMRELPVPFSQQHRKDAA